MMDEGGFIIDYVAPPGSSLTETNRMLSDILKIVRSLPEVESTSRRTGMQLGLATVTEANTGDISIKLKPDRKRDVYQIMDEIRIRAAREVPPENGDSPLVEVSGPQTATFRIRSQSPPRRVQR